MHTLCRSASRYSAASRPFTVREKALTGDFDAEGDADDDWEALDPDQADRWDLDELDDDQEPLPEHGDFWPDPDQGADDEGDRD